jgi:5-formyltetrahydrofolate cyclo-ligase
MDSMGGHLNILGDSEMLTKGSVRQKVWEFMEKNDIANFPRPVYHRIPNFKGAQAAGQQVATLPEFQMARTVKVSPDKPQEEVRYLVLEHNKDLIVPTPGLAKGLFNRLSVEPGSTKERIRQLASRQGIDELSKPVPMASR